MLKILGSCWHTLNIERYVLGQYNMVFILISSQEISNSHMNILNSYNCLFFHFLYFLQVLRAERDLVILIPSTAWPRKFTTVTSYGERRTVNMNHALGTGLQNLTNAMTTTHTEANYHLWSEALLQSWHSEYPINQYIQMALLARITGN